MDAPNEVVETRVREGESRVVDCSQVTTCGGRGMCLIPRWSEDFGKELIAEGCKHGKVDNS